MTEHNEYQPISYGEELSLKQYDFDKKIQADRIKKDLGDKEQLIEDGKE